MGKYFEIYRCKVCGEKYSDKALAEGCFDVCSQNISQCCVCDNSLFFDDDHCGLTGGVIVKIVGAYGSRHDNRKEIRAICDNCVEKMIGEREIPF